MWLDLREMSKTGKQELHFSTLRQACDLSMSKNRARVDEMAVSSEKLDDLADDVKRCDDTPHRMFSLRHFIIH
jgi:hypothetical protein